MNEQDSLTAYAASFIDELARNQVKHAVISPGSRSTPLALLFAEHPDITIHINVDERSAGFFALGLAKALQEPVAMLCTSGTATANFYPAIVEAFYARVPLIVLTADRPHELRDVGAPQTIDQMQMYGKHVKWFAEMAIPENTDVMIRYARTISARAAATAVKQPSGPVHVNFPLREPLVPAMKDVQTYRGQREATVQVEAGELSLSLKQMDNLANILSQSKAALIVCGELQTTESREAILQLADKWNVPILADPLSQLRSGQSAVNIIDCYDTILRDERACAALSPDLILRFGAMPVSKPLLLYMKKQRQAVHMVVDGGGGWREPAGLATNMIQSEEAVFCHGMTARLPEVQDSIWLSLWITINHAAKQALSSIRDGAELDEGKLFSLLSDLMPEDSHLFVGNSMPIRDLDTFFFTNNKSIRTYANRGANGIDGVVSTALGVSTVKENTVLVIGDLSFFHDMNGLLAAKLQKQNLTILLVNNDGGGIFSFLPQSSEKDYFEVLFGTPHGLDFELAVKLYGGKYHKVQNWDDFQENFTKSFTVPGLKVIEVPTNREENVLKHRDLWNYVSREMNVVLDKEKS